ncbi:hypothetical protein [Nocardioides faecalis]|nr:hypothetical protein [Nocardioides faecalis]
MSKFVRGAVVATVTLIAAVGVASVPSVAEADTGWGWVAVLR